MSTLSLAETCTADGVHVLQVDAPAAEDWAQAHHDAVRRLAAEHGAILLRGLGLGDRAGAVAVLTALGGGLITEREALAARVGLAPGVYASATWPAREPMCQHHESSYTDPTPGLILLACLTPAPVGGITGLADASIVLDALPDALVNRFASDGWLLTRTYHEGIGASWVAAFGTDDRTAVGLYCRRHAIEHRWEPDGVLRTRQRRPAVLTHRVTGRRCWFNQVAFLSQWTLHADVREFLLAEYGADDLPFNTAYGDGTPIEQDAVETINAVYEAATRREPWQAGDVMVIDNIATAHSREPYSGDREVLVAFAEPVEVTR